MKIKRVTDYTTFDTYMDQIVTLGVDWLRKAKVSDNMHEFIVDLRSGVHNPFKTLLFLIDGDVLLGLSMLVAIPNSSEMRVLVEHFYTNAKHSKLLWETTLRAAKRIYSVDLANICTITHRNPKAWIRFLAKHGYVLKPHAYVLRFGG